MRQIILNTRPSTVEFLQVKLILKVSLKGEKWLLIHDCVKLRCEHLKSSQWCKYLNQYEVAGSIDSEHLINKNLMFYSYFWQES